MLHAGLDLSRKRLDVCLLSEDCEVLAEFGAPPDADGLRGLARRVGGYGLAVRGVIESMTGARFVHDTLEQFGWEVLIADAQKVKGVAPLACKTDKIDARVLAVLSHRDLVPAIWLPDPRVRAEREQARFRLHLVKHRSMLKHRIHSTLITFGHPCPVTDLFGVAGRELLDRIAIPPPWRGTVDASLGLIEDLERQIDDINHQLRSSGVDHRYVPLLLTVPGIAWVLAFTIAAEIGDIDRFATAKKLVGYTGLCPKVNQSGDKDRRDPLSKHAPSTCAGRCLKPPCTPCATRSTASATSATRSAWAASAAPGSPRSTSPEGSPKRSGTCSPPTSPSTPLREAPLFVWPPDGPFGIAPPQPASHDARSSRRGGDTEMSAARHPPTARAP
jgi:transposase